MNRTANIILFVIGALFFAALVSLIYLPSSVIATGGAFPYTKHGATVGGENRTENGGVDRSVTGQWPPINEAGTYKKGECTHCHEPHASWGESEPYPNASSYPSFMTSTEATGPSPYLLFSDANPGGFLEGAGASFCWTCHENFTLQGNPQGWGYYGFYQGKSMWGAHITLGWVAQWPGEPPNGGASTIHPRNPRTKGARCLHCHTPHGIKGSASSPYDTWATPAANQIACTGTDIPAGCNPSLTADYLIPHQLLAWEEALCFNCHKSGGIAPNVKTEIEKRSLVGGSGHPVNDTTLAGRHFVGESLPITKKHVECYDCHNPHADNTSGCGGGIVTGKLSGMRYIDINGTVQDPCPKGARQPYIFEVCFKCHGNSYNQVFSGNAYPDNTLIRARSDGVTPDSRSNKRLEFDPNGTDATYGPIQAYNSAFHPVASAGRNTTLAICLQLRGTFTFNSTKTLLCDASYKFWMQNVTINCTDCHNSEAVGYGAIGNDNALGPVTETHIRSTDYPTSAFIKNEITGPHGSQIATPALNFYAGVSDSGDRSILRDYYFTGALPTASRSFNAPATTTEFKNRFRLCFNCHDWNTFYGNNNNTNFYNGGGMGMGPSNLHAFHLNGAGSGMGWNATYEACMVCHYNVHSNVQATNTSYDAGPGLPPDGDTHLINFAPNVVTGLSYAKPTWYYAGGQMNCNLYCHGVAMTYSYSCTHTLTRSDGVSDTSDTCNDN